MFEPALIAAACSVAFAIGDTDMMRERGGRRHARVEGGR